VEALVVLSSRLFFNFQQPLGGDQSQARPGHGPCGGPSLFQDQRMESAASASASTTTLQESQSATHISRATRHHSSCELVVTHLGKHYIATTRIPKGTIIHRETPFFIVSDDDMPTNVRERGINRIFFGSLLLSMNMKYYGPYLATLDYSNSLRVPIDRENPFPEDFHECYLKYHANSFAIDSFRPEFQPSKTALYEHASLYAHSCQPNCAHRFNSETNEIIIVSKEDIETGDEITICYMGAQYKGCPDDVWYRTVRQSFYERFGENCQCRHCAP
jgi:hypothetical protein